MVWWLCRERFCGLPDHESALRFINQLSREASQIINDQTRQKFQVLHRGRRKSQNPRWANSQNIHLMSTHWMRFGLGRMQNSQRFYFVINYKGDQSCLSTGLILAVNAFHREDHCIVLMLVHSNTGGTISNSTWLVIPSQPGWLDSFGGNFLPILNFGLDEVVSMPMAYTFLLETFRSAFEVVNFFGEILSYTPRINPPWVFNVSSIAASAQIFACRFWITRHRRERFILWNRKSQLVLLLNLQKNCLAPEQLEENMKPIHHTALFQEIHQQPAVISRLLSQPQDAIIELVQQIHARRITQVYIAARGTSDNAARYAQYLLGAYNNMLVSLATPSLFTVYRQSPNLSNTLVLGISQSGKSPDIISVLAEGKRHGALTTAITNTADSP